MPFSAYCWYTMPADERAIYKAILEGMEKMEKDYTIPPVTKEQMHRILYGLEMDNPQLYYVNFGGLSYYESGRIKVSYYFTKEQKRVLDYKIRLKTDYILKQAAGLPEEERFLRLHDWLVSHCTYLEHQTYPDAAHSILGPLLCGKSVCEGYAKAYKFLADKSHLYCAVICGEAIHPDGSSGGHAWNLINMNGKHYYVDVTFDHLIAVDYYSKAYYLLSTRQLLHDHRIGDRIPVPDCPESGSPLRTVGGTAELLRFLEEEEKRGAKYTEVRLTKGFTREELFAMIDKRTTLRDHKWLSRLDSYWYADYSRTLFVLWR